MTSQHSTLPAEALHKGHLRAYNVGTHKADVQLVGSMPRLLHDVRVATDIAAADCVVDREVTVLFFDATNPADAVVIAVQGALPTPGSGMAQHANEYHTPNMVSTTGAQSVAGVKTHTSIPVLPASNPTTDNQAARKKYVDDKLATHVAAADPHTGYQRESQKNAASGYAGLDGSTKLLTTQLRDNMRNARAVFTVPADATGQQDGKPTCPAGTITKVEVSVDGSGTCGATSVIVDIHKVPAANKNTDGTGTTIYATQANRPTISNGNRYTNATLPDSVAIADGDILIVYIDQVGTNVDFVTIVITIKRS